MLNKHYQVYIDNVLTLARSILLKSDYTAQKINDRLNTKFGEGTYVPSDRTTWKYYLNISGEYHNTDATIYVNSFDTSEEIPFTKAMLSEHTNTRNEYRVGTQFHKELITLYPTQEILIRGILTPTDINYAIDCEEFTLLGYAPEYVEENEYSLIENLQGFIRKHSERYHNKQFTISDDLYYSTYISTLTMCCVMAIMSHRLKMCKSSEAHSFHVQQYLNSYSKVGEHYKNLSHTQRMFFMRNIRYIERRTGTKENFDWLRSNLMDAINMPIASFEIRHDLSAMPEIVKPQVMFKKLPINTKRNLDAIDVYTLSNMMDLTDSLSVMNPSVRENSEIEFNRKAEHAINNKTGVKLLESTALTNDGGERYSLDEITLQHWAHLSATGVYKAQISFRTISTGQLIELDAKNALIFFIYSYAKSINKELVHVPRVIASRVILNEKPSFDDLRKLALPDIVTDAEINTILEEVPTTFAEIHSVPTFKSYCEKLFVLANKHIQQANLKAGILAHAQYYNVIARLWCDNYITDLYSGTYEAWFEENFIDQTLLTMDDYNSLWKYIYKEASGLDVDKKSALEDIQTAVTRLFMQLSSYSIQLVGNVKNSSAYKVGPSSIRYGNTLLKTENKTSLNTSTIRISNFTIHQTGSVFDNINAGGGINVQLKYVDSNSHKFKMSLDQKPRNINISIESENKYKVLPDMVHNVTVEALQEVTVIDTTNSELI